MKQVCLAVLILFGLTNSVSSQFNPSNLYVGIYTGYANPSELSGQIIGTGVLLGLKAGYKISDELSFGIDYTGFKQSYFEKSIIESERYRLRRYMIQSNYRFFHRFVLKPFIGLGIGGVKVKREFLKILNPSNKNVSRWALAWSAELGLTYKGFMVKYAFQSNGITPKNDMEIFNSADQKLFYRVTTIGYVYNFSSPLKS